MKNVLTIAAVLFFFVGNGQKIDSATLNAFNKLRIDRVKMRLDEINSLAMSINRYKGGALPKVLLINCLDTDRSYWESLHSPISVLWAILGKVNNKRSLAIILKKKINRLDGLCIYDPGNNPRIEIPMIDQSFRQLIYKRYRQLKARAQKKEQQTKEGRTKEGNSNCKIFNLNL